MSRTFSDVSTGWNGIYLTDASNSRPQQGGLVLQNVQHDGHNFAKDIRLVGLRLKINKIKPSGEIIASKSEFLSLSDPPFIFVGAIQILTPTATPSPNPYPDIWGSKVLTEAIYTLQFKEFFHDGYGLRTDYILRPTWFSSNYPNCEMAALSITQLFLFSRYGNNPVHEPGGVLHAARCHPLILYTLLPNEEVDRSRDYFRIESIRFDYRLHLSLDRHYSKPDALSQSGNQAGLFRDEETAGAWGALTPLSIGGVYAMGVTKLAFASVEKPLVFEVATQGLNEGLTILGTRTSLKAPPPNPARGWDNLHWWGARGKGNPIISTPGAFHCAHLHWRWGGFGSTIRSVFPQIDTSGVPTTVQSHPWADASARTLVDPGIWMQTIRIAVVLYDPDQDPNQPNQSLDQCSREDWASLFTSRSPMEIVSGGNIVLWYSTEVQRSTLLPAWLSFLGVKRHPSQEYFARNGGTVFLHGIFFAHNAEIPQFGVGDTGPAYWKVDEATIRSQRPRKWVRNA